MKGLNSVLDNSEEHTLRIFICAECRTTKNGLINKPPICHRRQMTLHIPDDGEGCGSLDHIH